MKTLPLFYLAVLAAFASQSSGIADDHTQSASTGTPTMAYYSKGKIIYYDFTAPKKYGQPYSSILATNPAYVRAHYTNPTMAYYSKKGTIYYDFTKSSPYGVGRTSDYFVQPEQKSSAAAGGAVTPVRSASGEQPQAVSPVKMRTTPMSNRESFEQEAEQTKGTPEENMAAIQASPADAASFYKRANAYKETYEYAKAIQDYSEVIRMEPENAYAYYKRGLCYSALSRMDLANENFRRANEIMSGKEEPWNQKSRSWSPQNGY